MRHADRSEQHKAPCGQTRRGDRQGLSPPSPIKANCLNLNQKKCKFLYDQDIVRSILEAYYEPQFSDHSHGFRPKRGCQTALTEIYNIWKGTKWFIEGDIKGCFDNIDHHILML